MKYVASMIGLLLTFGAARGASFDYELDTRPPPGPVTIVVAKDPVLCSSMAQAKAAPGMLKNWRIVPPVVPPADAVSNLFDDRFPGIEVYPKSEFGRFSKSIIDIDNDGKPETVYGFHSVNRYRVGDIFFVSPGPEVDAAWPQVSYKHFWDSNTYSFPHSAAKCVRDPCRFEDDTEFRISYQEKGKPVSYRLRYLSVWPFIWRSSTYFLLFSAEPDIRVSTVVRPRKGTDPEAICVFREKAAKRR
jgi:hypothetical protein